MKHQERIKEVHHDEEIIFIYSIKKHSKWFAMKNMILSEIIVNILEALVRDKIILMIMKFVKKYEKI